MSKGAAENVATAVPARGSHGSAVAPVADRGKVVPVSCRLRSQDGSSTLIMHFYIANHRGDTVLVIGESGAAESHLQYDAFGNVVVKSGSFTPSYTFSTKEHVPGANLYAYAYRVYDPIAGRWTQRDPIDYQDSVNLYQFCGNTPIIAYDVLGLSENHSETEIDWTAVRIYHEYYNWDGYRVHRSWEEIANSEESAAFYFFGRAGIDKQTSLLMYRIVVNVFFAGIEALATYQTMSALFAPIPSPSYVTVSRWGRPGLQSGDVVMKGGVSRLNYILSGKYQPAWMYGNNIPAAYRTGASFTVPRATLHWPSGFAGPAKGLIGQRIYIP